MENKQKTAPNRGLARIASTLINEMGLEDREVREVAEMEDTIAPADQSAPLPEAKDTFPPSDFRSASNQTDRMSSPELSADSEIALGSTIAPEELYCTPKLPIGMAQTIGPEGEAWNLSEKDLQSFVIGANVVPSGVSTVDSALIIERGGQTPSLNHYQVQQERRVALASAGQPHREPPNAFGIVDGHLYEVGEEMARGGMGRIMAACDLRLRREVAIKELLSDTATAQSRFKREALITARLQHPSIVKIYEAGRWESGEYFYTMERVNGRSFLEVMEGAKTLRARLGLLPHLIDVADAMAYAHSQRVIHRDLKPDNILVGLFGETIVIDWGLAKDLNEEEEELSEEEEANLRYSRPGHLTVAGAIMGTPNYMPPEQAEGTNVDERSDVYAIGAMLYQLIAGRVPFAGNTSREILIGLLSAPPTPLASLAPETPDELITIVETAMQRDINLRYRNAGVLAEDLRRFQTGKMVDAHDYSPVELLRRWLRRYRAPVAIGLISVLTLIVVMGISMNQIRKERNKARARGAELEVALGEVEHQRNEALLAHRTVAQQHLDAQHRRKEAIALANNATLLEARSFLDKNDPTGAISWLKRLNPEGPGWAAARVLAVDAWQHGAASHIFRGHKKTPLDAQLTSNGEYLISVGEEGVVKSWEMASGKMHRFQHSSGFRAPLEISADGKYAAAITNDGGVALLDLQQKSVHPVRGTFGTLTIRFGPTGNTLAVASEEGPLSIFNVEKLMGLYASKDPDAERKSKQRISGTLPSSAIEFSPDGMIVALVEKSGATVLRGLDGRRVVSFSSRWGDTRLVRFSPDAREVLILTKRGRAKLFNVQSGKQILNPRLLGSYSSAAFNPKRKHLALGGKTNIKVLDLKDPWASPREMSVESPIEHLNFSEDGSFLAAQTQEHHLHLWGFDRSDDPAKLREMESVRGFRFSPNGSNLLSVHEDKSIHITDLSPLYNQSIRLSENIVEAFAAPLLSPVPVVYAADSEGTIWRGLPLSPKPPERLVEAYEPVLDLIISPGSKFLAVFTAEDHIKVWEMKNFKGLQLRGAQRSHSPPIFSPDGAWIVAHGEAGDIDLWSLPKGIHKRLRLPPTNLTEHGVLSSDDQSSRFPNCRRALPQPLSFSADGKKLAVAFSCQNAVWIWDLPSETVKGIEFPGAKEITDVAFVPDGTQVIVSAGTTDTSIIDLESGERSLISENGHDEVRLKVSPDGRWVAAGIDVGLVRLWPLTEEDTPQDLIMDPKVIRRIHFSPNSQQLAVFSEGSLSAYVLDIPSGEHRILKGHTEALTDLLFLPDSRSIITAGQDHMVRAWRDDLPAEPAKLRVWMNAHVTTTIDDDQRPTTLPHLSGKGKTSHSAP